MFDAWEDQCERPIPESWVKIDAEPNARYQAAIAHVNHLGVILEKKFSNNFAEYKQLCDKSPIYRGAIAMDEL